MDYINIASDLSINAINKTLSIKFPYEVFKKDKNELDKQDLMLSISDGRCKIKNYDVKTEDNICFIFSLSLDFSSDGEQLIFLSGIVYDIYKKKYQIKDQIVNLNKEYLYFTGDSILKTDQGYIEIKNIEENKYSINDEKIIAINNGIDPNITNLILFKRGCIKYNVPDNDVLLKSNQKLYYDNKYIEVQEIFFKYNNKVELELVDYEKNYLYNIIADNTDYFEINSLNLQCLKQENTFFIDNYNYGLKTIESTVQNTIEGNLKEYNSKINNLKEDMNKLNNSLVKTYVNKELLVSLSKKINTLSNMNMNRNMNNESKKKNDNIKENKISNEVNTKFNRLIWDHWLKYGIKENKKMFKKLIFENADIERYKNDYKFLCNKLGNNNKKIWDHWIKHGINENKVMYSKITFENCNIDEYKLKYPNICEGLNYDNKKIWNSWINIDIKNNKIMNIKLFYGNADIERYKKDYPFLCKRIFKKLL